MRWPHLALSSSSSANNFQTTYDRYKERIKESERNGNIETVFDGIKRIRILETKNELYILPLNIAPTKNKDPVLIRCDGYEETRKEHLVSFCDTSYFHPDGFVLWYRFNRVDYPATEFAVLDHENREKIDFMIKEAQKWADSQGDAP
ncbi:MAG: hypothetical protein WBK77_10350 [Alphaproteobacteria bacterium]